MSFGLNELVYGVYFHLYKKFLHCRYYKQFKIPKNRVKHYLLLFFLGKEVFGTDPARPNKALVNPNLDNIIYNMIRTDTYADPYDSEKFITYKVGEPARLNSGARTATDLKFMFPIGISFEHHIISYNLNHLELKCMLP